MTREPIWTASFTTAFVAHFCFSLGFWMFVHLPGFLEHLGGGEAEIGVIIGTLSMSAILVRPWLGRLMDSRGRRPVVLIGGIVNLIAVAAYLTVDSLGPWIYVIRIIHGVGEAALFSVMFTIAADLVPLSRRTEGIAIFGVSGLLPLSLGGLLGDWLLSVGNYTLLFAVACGMGLLALGLSLPIRESRPPRDESTPVAGLVQIFFDRALLPMWLLTLAFTIGLTSYFTFIKTYIDKIQIGTVGTFFLAYSVVSVLLRLFLSWLPDRMGIKRTLVPTMLFLVVGILLLAHAQSVVMIIVAGILCGSSHAFVFPIISALVVTRSRDENRGAAMTLFTALFDLGSLIGAPLLGLTIEVGSYPAMFTVAASLVVVLASIFFYVDRIRS